ncbi:hypothetical protein B0T19DRAFT_72940 [Cercophora scortea]|uniref:Homeobox domain-containing protein n=1 Tax=Cercophora scortea TaxID=314031 RepID=A0AAE0J5T6_9PEZI|nr:hypothetical protein B0T19DRAFT_72940 [Cercophora scortea]
MDPQTPSRSSSPSQSRDVGIAGNYGPSSPNSSPELPTASHHSLSPDLGPDPSLQSQQQQQQQQQRQHPQRRSHVRHPKGKRKRTLAKDKSVLEAAYNANPKPDKAARLDIVKRVSLNEKEVQIWFQNRRQNDRRKSRPLSPQEIAALRYGGMQILSSDAVSYNSSFGTDIGSTSPEQALSQPEQEEGQEQEQQQEQNHDLNHGSSSPPRSQHSQHSKSSSQGDRETAARIKAPQETPRRDEAEIRFPAGLETVTPVQRDGSEPAQQQPPQFLSSSVGYLSNRWNPASSFSTPSTLGRAVADESFKLESFEPSSCSSSTSLPQILPPPSSQSSQFRLSLSLEGKAEVVSAIPSPPRFSAPTPPAAALREFGPVPRPNFQRSHSASSLVTLPPISALTSSLPVSTPLALPPRLTRGRSRDVHAWEFCCDAENREDALTAQAKHESSGSAIAAISLLRSTSASGCGSPLQPGSSAKRNAATSKAAPRSEQANKKAKLGRALSSVARLQTNTGLGNKQQAEKPVQSDNNKFKVSMLMSPSGNESDKENWSPDEAGNPCFSFQQPSFTSGIGGRQPAPSSTSREDKRNPRRTPGRVLLQEYRSPTFQLSTRANTAPAYGRKPRRDTKPGQSNLDIFEDSETNGPASPRDDEVERFMRGEVSPSKKGDAAAIAGLLSLSQGNWR